MKIKKQQSMVIFTLQKQGVGVVKFQIPSEGILEEMARVVAQVDGEIEDHIGSKLEAFLHSEAHAAKLQSLKNQLGIYKGMQGGVQLMISLGGLRNKHETTNITIMV